MKKILSSILISLLSFYIFACGNKSIVAVTGAENEISELTQMYLDIKDGKRDSHTTSIMYSNYKKDCKMDFEGNLYEYETYDYKYNYRVQNTQSLIIYYKDGKKKTYYYTDGSVFQSFGEIAKIDDVDSDREEVLKVFNEYKNMKDDYTSIANIIKRIMKFA